MCGRQGAVSGCRDVRQTHIFQSIKRDGVRMEGWVWKGIASLTFMVVPTTDVPPRRGPGKKSPHPVLRALPIFRCTYGGSEWVC